MRKYRIIIIYFVIFFILLTSSACNQKSEPKAIKKPNPILLAIEGIEADLVALMGQIDLIPYYEKQINEKKLEEKKQIEISIAQGSKEENASKGAEQSTKEFEPKPITINDILLYEIVKAEASDAKEQKIPDDIIFIWYEINSKINSLHEKWNEVEPKILEANIPSDAINGFENTLNSLTITSAKNIYMESLMNANRLSSFIPQFLQDPENKITSSLYTIKYHVRQIVLDAANNDYLKANENFQSIKSHEETIVYTLIEEKSKDLADKLKTSISDLENAIQIKDINIIKIKSSVVIKNISAIKKKQGQK